eukprot:CAMPEP_0204355536 /NCGR_PEP_ID=MMETSP0469-20131031/34217_1 /ASSEMBLY_ACC=CAM_ASM_000384 /TAXON_ID=2969 /ORGANISM="Oxyrrhis marina" /LENGTH=61 /DNA_ID=CAMNT_0051342799 /DNA_START=99 /DNA_END=284 /DNA_ORIENTATION=-
MIYIVDAPKDIGENGRLLGLKQLEYIPHSRDGVNASLTKFQWLSPQQSGPKQKKSKKDKEE